ncbi:MAG: hypothetical protein CMJ78_27035 [Planctomycetaceae bacterium]|nr:hypothetical protein [Planctomycetaceae bacterium]
MNTPFEELEYLAEYLPDEGEAVIVSRRQGELVCEAYQQSEVKAGISDVGFYGRLVQANEQLSTLAAFPTWICILGYFWLCVLLHKTTDIGWPLWFVDLGLMPIVCAIGYKWVRHRRSQFFEREVQPILEWQLRRREMDVFQLIGNVRQRSELSVLMQELWRW